jgi:CBS domain-containing protein
MAPKGVAEVCVKEAMTAAPIAVRPHTTIAELRALFETHGFNAFPVVNQDAMLVGIVTGVDFLSVFRPNRRTWAPGLGANPARMVEHIMHRGLVVVGPDDPIVKAIDLMVEHDMRSLPVAVRAAGGLSLVGILTRRDLFKHLTLDPRLDR